VGGGNGGVIDERAAAFYMGCIVLGLERIHAAGYVYRDLKLENVLLDARGRGVIENKHSTGGGSTSPARASL